MEKVIRATERAKTQARRKLLAARSKIASYEAMKNRAAKADNQRSISSDIRIARAVRREDWLLGPLAPRRDVGNSKGSYATVSSRRLQGPKTTGKPHDYCIEQGDRVVVVGKEFRDRGKIGQVKEVRTEEEECLIEGLNLVR